MSWQRALACWILRRQFLPLTQTTKVDVERARVLSGNRVWSPRVPAGWELRERYGATDWPLHGEWLERVDRVDRPAGVFMLYLHGGGYYFCSPRTHRAISFGLAARGATRAFSLDYRLAPEHRFPAALDDAVAAYRGLLDAGVAPATIVIAGDSAGGGLALALLVALRDAGAPLPAGAVLLSPWTDLAATGASIKSNDGVDPMFSGASVARAAQLYLGDTPATEPLASPLYADLAGLPPLFIQVGSTEVLLDDGRRVADKARAAGVAVELEVWPKVPHVWQMWAPFMPEAGRALEHAARFMRRVVLANRDRDGGSGAQPSSEMSIV